ncbi:MAG: hypothetical protein RLZZ592_2219, partial [Pseudomonadota bacterium]
MTAADDLLPVDPARRRGLGAAAAWMMLASLGAGRAQAGSAGTAPALSFTPVPMMVEAPLAVPPGYTARVLYAWGDATGQDAVPPWRSDAVPTPAEQALQAGMHHDGMAFFPLGGRGVLNGRHGLLALNHEYTDERLLHRDVASLAGGARPPEQVARSQAAHGVSVIEVQRAGAGTAAPWSVVRPSRRARRV